MALAAGSLIWCAVAQSFNSLLAARIVLGFATASGEVGLQYLRCFPAVADSIAQSIVPEIVSDMFFVHQRAAMMSM